MPVGGLCDDPVTALRRGQIVAYPTEAVWGLGVDPWNQLATERLLRVKNRPWHKGLIVVAADCNQIQPLLEPLKAERRRLLAQTWPGPVTWLIPDPSQWIPPWVKGDHALVAVRVSAHPVVQSVCRAWGGPVISTSANRAAAPPLQTAQAVQSEFGDELGCVVRGDTGGMAGPTCIRNLLTGEQVRATGGAGSVC